MGKLTDTECRRSQPREKPYKLADGGGLHLYVSPSGGKLWRLKYRYGGKEKLLSFGRYPAIPLTRARLLSAAAHETMAQGADPSAIKAEIKASARRAEAVDGDPAGPTFADVAKTWFDEHSTSKNPRTSARWSTFIDYTAVEIGGIPLSAIRAADLVRMVKAIDTTGKHETARRTFSTVGRIFRYAVAHGLAERDPSRDVSLKDFLPSVETRHHACLTDPKAIGGLLRAIDGYEGGPITRLALNLAALTFVRPGELRHAEWSEIDAEAAEWRIPADKMKMKAIHIVPLSAQALATIEAVRGLTGGGRYLFPSERSAQRAMSDNTVNAALRRMGYTKEEMTGHGFRGTASTRLHELGYRHQVIEIQLAHGERNEVAAAYNFAEYLPERRTMMQAWADHLDQLRQGAKVIAFAA
jgi:integrase